MSQDKSQLSKIVQKFQNGKEIKTGAAERWTLEHLIETGIPFTVEEFYEVCIADRIEMMI
jgi:hypothetical protein